jgi:hypothetical protein
MEPYIYIKGDLIFGKNEKLFSWNGIKFNGGE